MRKTMRPVNNLQFATCLLVFSLAASAIALAQTLLATSRVVHYTPAHMTVRATLSGACLGKSLRVARSDAYRCASGSTTYDPCFTRKGARVACPTDVFADRGTIVRLTRPLPRLESVPSPSAVWAMLLASGAHCLRLSLASAVAHPFRCTSRSGALACASPRLQEAVVAAYFVDCVTTGARVANVGSTLARIIYR